MQKKGGGGALLPIGRGLLLNELLSQYRHRNLPNTDVNYRTHKSDANTLS